MAIEKIQIPGAVLEIPAKQHCQFSPFGPLYEVNGLEWQCYLAGSSRTAPGILIFSIAIGVNRSYEMKSSEIYAPAFFKHFSSFIVTVNSSSLSLVMFSYNPTFFGNTNCFLSAICPRITGN